MLAGAPMIVSRYNEYLTCTVLGVGEGVGVGLLEG